MAADNSPNRCAYPWQQMIIDLTGEVVPCCFWAGYGNSGAPLGNTNTNSVDEIWHGEAYQRLREKVASGDLEGHPCGTCMAYRWANGIFPRFTWPAGFVHEQGLCYLGQIPEEFLKASENAEQPVRLYEDDKELPHPDAPHDRIRQIGTGNYSVWHGWIYFSSSDNSDPLKSGRVYRLVCGDHACELGSLVKDSLSGRNLIKAYGEYVGGRIDIECEPSMISFISTADCNIDCPACSQNIVRVAKVQHRPETMPGVLAKVPYLSQFIWHGGEPYLIERFRKFIDDFNTSDNPNLTFGFTSNGTMIVEEEAEKLKKFPRVNASVSMDSFNVRTFKKIRAGAEFDRVWQNVKRLLGMYSAPARVFSIGMIVCKSNFRELSDNLQFAIDNDVGLNLSPIVLYPVIEQLNCFADFESETEGWQEALERATAVVTKAKSEGRRAVQRVDPTGMVEELRRILEKARTEYSNTVQMLCQINDEHGSIAHMRRPAVVVYDHAARARAYVKLRPSIDSYVIEIPQCLVANGDRIRVDLVHDVMEPNGVLVTGRVSSHTPEIRIYVPQFTGALRPRNINWANYGASTPDGNYIQDPKEIHHIYRLMYKDELPDTRRDARLRADESPSGSARITLIDPSNHEARRWLRNVTQRAKYMLAQARERVISGR
jgi:radical SAM protein with 4Fe4S-binding SPASM domain